MVLHYSVACVLIAVSVVLQRDNNKLFFGCYLCFSQLHQHLRLLAFRELRIVNYMPLIAIRYVTYSTLIHYVMSATVKVDDNNYLV